MKKQILLAVAGLSLGALPLENSAQVFADDFQSYSNDAELTAVWERVSGDGTSIFLSTDPSDSSNRTIEQTTAVGRVRHTTTPTVGTVENPLVFSFDLYDANGGETTGRVFGELRQSDGVGGLMAAGIYNNAEHGPAFSQSRYQARLLDAGGTGWIQLDAPRSVGWHNFQFVIAGNSVDLFVDGVLDPQFTDRTLNGTYDYDWINIGSALSGGVGAHFDNVELTVVPEPTTYAMVFGLLALGGAIVYRRRTARA